MSTFLDILKQLFFGRQISTKTARYKRSTIEKGALAMKSDDMSVKKSVLIEMDSILGAALNDLYGKNSVSENLKKAKNRFSSDVYQKAWDAHKMRNRLVHEPTAIYNSTELDESVRKFITVLSKI